MTSDPDKMANAVSVKNNQGQLACSVCQNKNNDMVLSSCFHTFCMDCVQIQTTQSFNKESYRCPLCKSIVKLPRSFRGNKDSRAGGFGVNFENGRKSAFCDICFDHRYAVNRCLQCNENFCEDCTNAHLRMKASRYHGQLVVPIRNRRDKYIEIADDARYCTRHRNQEVVLVCQQCRVPLCLVCKLMEHPNHVTKTVVEDAMGIREKLSDVLQSQIGYSENLQMRIRRMNDTTNQYPLKLDQELRKVDLQAMKLHSAIEKARVHREKELVSYYDDFTTQSARQGENLKQDYNAYLSLTQEAGKLLESDNDVLVVKKGENICERLKRLESRQEPLSDINKDKPGKKFLASKIDDKQVSNLIGRVTLDDKGKLVRIRTEESIIPNKQERHDSVMSEQTNEPDEPSIVSGNKTGTTAELLNQIWLPFNDGIGYVYGIAAAGNQQVWVSLLDHKYIVLVDQQGLEHSRVDVGEVCEDVASDGQGGCFVSCPYSRLIKRVSRSGEVVTILDNVGIIAKPRNSSLIKAGVTRFCNNTDDNLIQQPHGLATLVHYDTRQFQLHQELYVCLTEPKGLNMEIDPNTKRGSVCGLSFTGSNLGVSIPIKAPVRVAVSSEPTTLAIVDHANGCVMVTDKSGQFVQALYSGRDNGEIFQPLGVCFDGSGRVLFADWHCGKVCQMARDGSVVHDLITNLDGPQSLAVTDGNILWVGGKLGKLYVYKLNEQ